MRNWNQDFALQSKIKRLRFQPTYEELKHILIPINSSARVQFPAYLWGIETAFCAALMRAWPGFQPTYEELKPQQQVRKQERKPVSSLPMRNWNPSKCFSNIIRSLVSSLPMRNWNPGGLDLRSALPSWFPAYLWGIETRDLNPFTITAILVSSLPMRNWNPTVITSNIYLEELFPAYLWGIETLILDDVGAEKWTVSSLPMRNWNRKSTLSASFVALFPAYLWGIETGNKRHFRGKQEKFPAYLWGIETCLRRFRSW